MSARADAPSEPRWSALLPVGYALAVTLYTELRYGFRWGDSDTAQIVSSARSVFAQGTIAPTGGAYPHGYAYQAVIVALARVSGLGVARVDLVVLPFVAVVTALAAFVAFRAITGSALLGGIAAVLLFIEPEFVFVVERGSHEKMTESFVLLLVFLLAATLTRRPTAGAAVAHVVAFYALAWALISTNAFFASSFFLSLAIALAAGAVVLWRSRSPATERAALHRLIYTVLSGVALVFVFVVYVYAPARYNFGVLRSLIDRVSALLLSFDIQSNPYASIVAPTGAAWAAPWLYPLLTSFDIAVALAALGTALWLAVHFWRHGLAFDERGRLLLWLLAAAFGVEVVASIGVDLSGFLATNIQIRLFPLFMLFAIPLTVIGAAALLERVRVRRGVLAALGFVLVALFALAGILKATNDPLVSNKWLFYTAGERSALAWADRSLSHQTIWVGFDERLLVMRDLEGTSVPANGNTEVAGTLDQATRYVLMSDVIRQRSPRLNLPAPDVLPDDRIYDNGRTEIYHRVPQTPYQP